jgi:hypothetical protein
MKPNRLYRLLTLGWLISFSFACSSTHKTVTKPVLASQAAAVIHPNWTSYISANSVSALIFDAGYIYHKYPYGACNGREAGLS